MRTVSQPQPPTRRHRTNVRGTGALHEILPYYRWGMLAGVLGAFVVAVFFLALDLAAGRPLATPNALGATLFLGVPFDLARPVNLILVAGYSAVHGGLFVGLALLVSSLVLGSQHRPPPSGSLTLILTGWFFAGLMLLFLGFALPTSSELASWPRAGLVLAANLLAATAMGLLLNYAFQTRWRPESKLIPRAGRPEIQERRFSHVGSDHLRDPEERGSRLDPEWFHLFSLPHYVNKLRSEPEYQSHGRTGIVLIKTERLRVVLEVAAEGVKFDEHTVFGSAMLVVLDGMLEVTCADEKRTARGGEMVVVPHDRPRSMSAASDVSFLWTLAMEAPDADADARSFGPFGPEQAFGPRGR